jgi:hypothetical protein
LSQQLNEASSHYDDLLEKKLEKNINFQMFSTRVYLWRTVAYLLKHCKLNKDSVQKHKLTADEQELLIQD